MTFVDIDDMSMSTTTDNASTSTSAVNIKMVLLASIDEERAGQPSIRFVDARELTDEIDVGGHFESTIRHHVRELVLEKILKYNLSNPLLILEPHFEVARVPEILNYRLRMRETLEAKILENSIDGEEEEGGTADEPATATPEIQSSNVLSKTPGSDKSPAEGKRRKLENLTQAVQQLRELSQNIQDSSNNEHEAFGNFVAATLNNLGKADALMAQHEIQGILFKYRLANVDASKHSSFQEPNSNKNTQTTPYSYNSSLESPYSNHSIDGYPHQHFIQINIPMHLNKLILKDRVST
ncbi:hypothetical protein FQA39_LY04490 [Lamprigera yunnana]|nr:hypothetical protein FQA39_LY04490 [Lamprigera yunnana]